MADPSDPKQNPKRDEQQKPREASPGQQRKPEHRGPDREGMPGYGQPPEEVQREKLPEQEWK